MQQLVGQCKVLRATVRTSGLLQPTLLEASFGLTQEIPITAVLDWCLDVFGELVGNSSKTLLLILAADAKVLQIALNNPPLAAQ